LTLVVQPTHPHPKKAWRAAPEDLFWIFFKHKRSIDLGSARWIRIWKKAWRAAPRRSFLNFLQAR